MTKDKQLREIQKRIAEARGYTDVRLSRVEYGGELLGVLHADEGVTMLPRWPQEWCDAGVLVEEMRAAATDGGGWCEWADLWEGTKWGPHAFQMHDGTVKHRAGGQTFAEAVARCWCVWRGIDLSDIQ